MRGLARFEGDTYHLRQTGADLNVPGNPWFICTLWMAQYQLQRAKVPADLEAPLEILCQVEELRLPSGVLAEQTDAASGEPAGATPLTWSHATVILTVLEYLNAKARICGARLERESPVRAYGGLAGQLKQSPGGRTLSSTKSSREASWTRTAMEWAISGAFSAEARLPERPWRGCTVAHTCLPFSLEGLRLRRR